MPQKVVFWVKLWKLSTGGRTWGDRQLERGMPRFKEYTKVCIYGQVFS